MTSKLAPPTGVQEQQRGDCDDLREELLADLAIDTLMDLAVTRELDRQLRCLAARPVTRVRPGAQKQQGGDGSAEEE